MTEQEWLECAEPWEMAALAWEQGSERQRCLFAAACCRRVWHLLTDEQSRHAVDVAERAADGLVSCQTLAEACAAIPLPHPSGMPTPVDNAATAVFALDGYDPRLIAAAAADAVGGNPDGTESADRLCAEKVAQCGLLREIMGNPFRPVCSDPGWLTSTVVSLATAIYDERAFDRLPILADALEDAGCDNADILNHLRQPGEHVRGCWVVDLLLGKE